MVFVRFCRTTLGSENGYAMDFVCYEYFLSQHRIVFEREYIKSNFRRNFCEKSEY